MALTESRRHWFVKPPSTLVPEKKQKKGKKIEKKDKTKKKGVEKKA